MAKSITLTVLFLLFSNASLAKISSSFTEQEMNTLSPFDSEVQQRVLKDVVQIMMQTFDPSLELPEIRVSESVQESEKEILETAESQGMPGWALSKGINMYLLRLNMIVLGEEMKIHNLAHEYAHYVQVKYKKSSEDQFTGDDLEMEAVHVQNYFRPNK